jgi:HD-GYP domain-containing protein (c-di-GMP phosphodiesterase class II)
MRHDLRENLAPLLTLAGAAVAGPALLLGFVGHHAVHLSGTVHFAGVGVSALAAAAAAVALTAVGARRNDGRTVLVGTAFSVMAALLALHGLATPGILIGQNGLIALTGGATLPVGGAVLALTALPSLRRPRDVRRLVVLEGALIAAVLALGALGMLDPSLVPGVPAAGSAAALTLLAVGLAFYALLAVRALNTYVLTRRANDLVVVLGIAWLTAALPPALMLNYVQLGWWLGHGFELAGIVLVGIAVARDLQRAEASHPLVGDLRGASLVDAEEAFLGGRVRSLMLRLAEKDESTEEHTRRVALRAVHVGEELGLPPGRLRNLAMGGLLHDMGKLQVPDSILKKPDDLDERERAVVQCHTTWGYRLLGDLGGFPEPVRRLVRDHHERLDGTGYPAGRTADDLDLDTRILTVCDIYDALISARIYRAAWTHDRALGLLRDEAGTALDVRCVAALERVLANERPVARHATVRQPLHAT